jgi:ABC-type phosphate transport system substrate-binding protein
MMSFSKRRATACIASAAALVAVAAPATASAAKAPVTDRGEQCSGVSIVGRGSTFQDPAQLVWQPGFNTNTSTVACSGTQGSKGKPTATYRNTESKDRGSGACLKAFGAEKEAPNHEYSFCGTDEAPNETQKNEIESHKTGGGSESLETIPVLQGAVAIIVHLPEGCKATATNVVVDEKTRTLGRLVLNDSTIDGIYKGTITTWKGLLEAQPNDSMTCANEAEKEDTISPVVRTDHSGTTHIFKAFLSLVDTAPIEMEAYKEAYGTGSAKSSTGCGKEFPAEPKTWAEVSEGCPNQRWPLAAHVIRNETETGNPGVINLVNSTPSSVGYADLAVAREKKFFSTKGSGGEIKKGEQNTRFWAPVQNSSGATYSDPSSKGDTEKLASSNCKNTRYIENGEKEFPPASTRSLWNEAKAALVEENYPICGLTYDITYREFKPYLLGTPFEAEGKGIATTVENYLMYEISTKGGGKEVKNHDYEALSTEVRKKAETGIKEIGYEIA